MRSGAWAGWLVVLLAGCPPTPEPPVTELDASVPGNSCASAMVFELPTDGGTVVLDGDATGFGDHARCTYFAGKGVRAAGPEHIYRFTTTQPLALDARIDGGTLHLGSASCEIDCSNVAAMYGGLGRAAAPFDLAHLRMALPAGEHTLFAEADGAYRVELRARPLLVGETCEAPLVLPPDAGVVRLDAADYFDEAWPAVPLGCSQTPCTATAYVAVTAPAPMGLRVAASTPVANVSVRTVGACGSEPTVFDAAGAVLGAGAHVIGVEVKETAVQQLASYPVELAFELAPLAPGDRCADAVPLVLEASDGGVTLTARAEGDTRLAFPSDGGSCGGARSNDVFFAFTLTAPSDLRAEVTTMSATFQPALSLRAGRCEGAPAACATAVVPGAGATVRATALPAGSYGLSLSGVGVTAGPYVVELEVVGR